MMIKELNKKQIISLSLIILLVLNIVLFAMKRIKPLLFWLVLGMVALMAYKWVPKI